MEFDRVLYFAALVGAWVSGYLCCLGVAKVRARRVSEASSQHDRPPWMPPFGHLDAEGRWVLPPGAVYEPLPQARPAATGRPGRALT